MDKIHRTRKCSDFSILNDNPPPWPERCASCDLEPQMWVLFYPCRHSLCNCCAYHQAYKRLKEGYSPLCYLCGAYIADFFEALPEPLRMERYRLAENELGGKSDFIANYRPRDISTETEKWKAYDFMFPLRKSSLFYSDK